jgi:hypothetical protein
MPTSSGKELPEAIIVNQRKTTTWSGALTAFTVSTVYRYGAVTGIQPGGGGAGW